MKSYHPNPFTHVDISHRDWIRLGAASLTGKPEWQIVEQAIDEWMRRHDENNCAEPEFAGYQWKGVFLPDGTVLRTVFKGKNHHCRVEGDQILYEGQARSPSGFVNAVGGIRRNAWKSVWLLFPDSKHWQLADRLRAPKRPVRARRTAHTARAATVAPASALPVEAPPAPPEHAPAPSAGPAGPARPAPPVPAAAPSVRPTRSAPPAGPAQQAGTLFALPLASAYRWTVRQTSP
jgi:hypothetical protein